MALKLAALFLVATGLLAGCSTYPTTPEAQARSDLAIAGDEIRSGSAEKALMHLNYAADVPGQEAVMRDLFRSNPSYQAFYVSQTLTRIPQLTAPSDFSMLYARFGAMATTEILTGDEASKLRAALATRAQAGNLTGEVPFLLTDRLVGLGLLESRKHMRVILGRSAEAQRVSHRAGLVQAIVAYSIDPEVPLDEKKYVEDMLDWLYIPQEDLQFVSGLYPAFAKRRAEFLARAGQDGAKPHIVRQSVWNGLSEASRSLAERNYRVFVNPDADYGMVADVQTINRSTGGSTAGSTVGASVAQIAYVDRSFDNMTYSPWSQIGFGILGAIAGSVANTAPVERYQHIYTVRRGNGELFKSEQMGGAADRMAPGTCVTLPALNQVPQQICEETPSSFEARMLRPMRKV